MPIVNAFKAAYYFVASHPFWTLFLVGLWITFVQSLKAPTKDSKQWYVSTFAVLNFTVLQFQRMFPKVENSPNFTDAVKLQEQLQQQQNK